MNKSNIERSVDRLKDRRDTWIEVKELLTDLSPSSRILVEEKIKWIEDTLHLKEQTKRILNVR